MARGGVAGRALWFPVGLVLVFPSARAADLDLDLDHNLKVMLALLVKGACISSPFEARGVEATKGVGETLSRETL